jgi:hypothetical protein
VIGWKSSITAIAWRDSGTLCARSIFIFFCGNVPNGAGEIELGPLRMTQLAKPHECQGDPLQRCLRGRLTIYVVDGAQQRADGFRIGDRRSMLDLWRYQSAGEMRRRIAIGSIGRDGVSKHATAEASRSARCIVPTATFDLAQYLEQLRRLDIRDRAITQVGIDEAEQPFLLFEGFRIIAFGFELRQELFRDNPERVGTGNARGTSIKLSLDRWADGPRPFARRALFASRAVRASARETAG